MPYEITLENDSDRGLDRYTVRITGELDPDEAGRLGDWLATAAQNPTATFELDVSRADPDRDRPLSRLLARVARLHARGRLNLVRPRRSARSGARARPT